MELLYDELEAAEYSFPNLEFKVREEDIGAYPFSVMRVKIRCTNIINGRESYLTIPSNLIASLKQGFLRKQLDVLAINVYRGE